ncbi:MAG: 3'-5' exonuclease [Actinomycetes bacterium]
MGKADGGHPEEFLAIDFETAASFRESACAVGVAYFAEGVMVENTATLIDPGLGRSAWSHFNIGIHGIQPEDVEGAPTFMEAWTDLMGKYPGVPLVAHNAAFDMGVVRAELTAAGGRLDSPLLYTCSAAVAKATWTDMKSVSLPVISERLGIELNHHEAGSDARACGEVMLHAVEKLGTNSVEEALGHLNRTWGEIQTDLTWTTGSRSKRTGSKRAGRKPS